MPPRTYELDVEKIQRELDHLGWSYARLAHEAKIKPYTLTRVLKNGQRASLDTLMAIARALRVKKHLSLEKGYVDADAPSLKDKTLRYFVIGVRYDEDYSDASYDKHAHPVIQELKRHRGVEYIASLGFTEISSFLAWLELSDDNIVTVAIPAFLNGDFHQYGVTSVYIPTRFQNHVVSQLDDDIKDAFAKQQHIAFNGISLFVLWFAVVYRDVASGRWELRITRDGTVVVKHSPSITATVAQ